MKVRNMNSPRTGRPVANQYIIEVNESIGAEEVYAEYFQSYDSVIAVIRTGKVTLDKNTWDYSVTTGKYRNEFLGEGIAETRKKIESGEYTLEDLN